jgi:hypothetical protein
MRKRGYKSAAILFVVALALWFGSPSIAERFTTPLRRSFPVVTGQHASFSFTPILSERHYIEVQFERNLPFERLKEIIGPFGEPTSRPLIEFSVDSRAQRIEIKPERGQNWGELVGFALSSFDAKRGAHYTLTADVRSADPDLRTLNGQLFVRVHPMTVKEFYMLVLYSKALAIILAVIAAIVFLVRVARSRAADTGAAPSRSSAASTQ